MDPQLRYFSLSAFESHGGARSVGIVHSTCSTALVSAPSSPLGPVRMPRTLPAAATKL